jgi:hypothetical protein
MKKVEPIRPTAEQLERVVPTLNRLQFGRLLRVVLKIGGGEKSGWHKTTCLREATQLKVYAYEWLVHLGFLPEDRIRWVMDQISDDLGVAAAEVSFLWPDITPSMAMLTVADRRFVNLKTSCKPRSPWLDVETEETHAKLNGHLLVTYISADLPILFAQKQAMLKRLEGTDANSTD